MGEDDELSHGGQKGVGPHYRHTEFAYDGLGRRVKIIEKGPRVTAVVQPVSGSYSLYDGAGHAAGGELHG